MDTSVNVSPGDAWHPESAGRFNRISDMLNTIGVIGPAGQYLPSDATAVIIRRNTGAATIPAASYVTFDDTGMRPGIDDPCGVAMAECAPGEEGPVQVNGIAELSCAFPRPAHVLVLKKDPHNGPTTVLLNSTGHKTYRNYFAVDATGWNANGYVTGFSITDGGYPDNPDCGLTDVGPVRKGTLTRSQPFSYGYVCLRLIVGDDGGEPTYSHVFEWNTAAPDPWEPVIILAEVVRSGNQFVLVQRWTGGVVYWRQRFVIGFGRARPLRS